MSATEWKVKVDAGETTALYESGTGDGAELPLFVCAHGAGGSMSDRGMVATAADHSFHVLKSSGTTDAAVMAHIAATSAACLARLSAR
jgi:hypothetical protein